eukprot:TRINITY_DN1326_c0_g1_i2.p2 TRINITY_DN1326_c0_g1~~TRINITY_DN1326_c0_g1_i2.p2  ORF type:complete len:283 (+),score=51.86 TRINITY_DN1326_c0_g1_i2:68-916(+)
MKLTDASLTSFHPSQLRISTPMKHTNTAPIDPIASKGFIHRIRTMTPFNILCYLTIVNLLNYFDRGAIAGVLTSIEREFDLSNTSDGLLAGAFMVGFMITNPIFAHLSYKYQPTNLMFIGLLVWSIATVASVWASSFHMLAFCRMVTGIGEASFAGLAPTYIDDHAPIESRTKWLSLFYSAIPLGGALGYIASGFISEYWKWRGVFYIEGELTDISLSFLFVTSSFSSLSSSLDPSRRNNYHVQCLYFRLHDAPTCVIVFVAAKKPQRGLHKVDALSRNIHT